MRGFLSILFMMLAATLSAELVTANEYGVACINSSAKRVVIAVPWTATDGDAIAISELVLTNGFAVEDEVHCWDVSKGAYSACWQLATNSTWMSANVVSSEGITTDSPLLRRDNALVVLRENPTGPIYVGGQVANSAVTNELLGDGAYNLVAPPFARVVDINDSAAVAFTGIDPDDFIIFDVGGGKLLFCHWREGKWQYEKQSTSTLGGITITEKTWAQAPVIGGNGADDVPLCTGFWYFSCGNGTKIEWKQRQ